TSRRMPESGSPRYRVSPRVVRRRRAVAAAVLLAISTLPACRSTMPPTDPALANYVLDYDAPVDAALQADLDSIDARVRARHGIAPEQTDVGVLDLARLRLAMIHPDHIEYAASVAKIGILLAYFQDHPDAGTRLAPRTRHELGLMIKASSNEMASKFSHEI